VTKKQVFVGSLLFMFVVVSKGAVLSCFAAKKLLLLVYYSGQSIITPPPDCWYLTVFYLKILNINLELTFNLQDVLVITGHLAITYCIHLPSNRVLD